MWLSTLFTSEMASRFIGLYGSGGTFARIAQVYFTSDYSQPGKVLEIFTTGSSIDGGSVTSYGTGLATTSGVWDIGAQTGRMQWLAEYTASAWSDYREFAWGTQIWVNAATSGPGTNSYFYNRFDITVSPLGLGSYMAATGWTSLSAIFTGQLGAGTSVFAGIYRARLLDWYLGAYLEGTLVSTTFALNGSVPTATYVVRFWNNTGNAVFPQNVTLYASFRGSSPSIDSANIVYDIYCISGTNNPTAGTLTEMANNDAYLATFFFPVVAEYGYA